MIQKKGPMNLTEQNIDWLMDFLSNEHMPTKIAEQIPAGAHIFPGSVYDPGLTETNLRLASRILLGMTLGYVEEAPLIMVYTDRTHTQRLIDLASDTLRQQTQRYIETFQTENGQRLISTIQELTPL